MIIILGVLSGRGSLLTMMLSLQSGPCAPPRPVARQQPVPQRCCFGPTRRNVSTNAAAENLLEQELSTSQRPITNEHPGVLLQPRQVHFVDEKNSGKQGFVTVRGVLHMRADPLLVFQVLTAYEACERVFTNIESSQVEAKEDGQLEVLQKCCWSFLAFSGSFDCRLSVDEDHANKKVRFQLLSSSFMRDFEGRWHISDGPSSSDGSSSSGSDDAPTCVVEHVLSVMPMIPIPAPFAYYSRSIFIKQVEVVLKDLEREVVRQQTLQHFN